MPNLTTFEEEPELKSMLVAPGIISPERPSHPKWSQVALLDNQALWVAQAKT